MGKKRSGGKKGKSPSSVKGVPAPSPSRSSAPSSRDSGSTDELESRVSSAPEAPASAEVVPAASSGPTSEPAPEKAALPASEAPAAAKAEESSKPAAEAKASEAATKADEAPATSGEQSTTRDSLAPTTGPSKVEASEPTAPPSDPPAVRDEPVKLEKSEPKAAQKGGKSKGKSDEKPRKSSLDEDDTDKAFFDGEVDAIAKLHAEGSKAEYAVSAIDLSDEDEPRRRVAITLTPELIARRKQLRKIVQVVVGACALLSLGVIVKMATSSKDNTPPSAFVARTSTAAPTAHPTTTHAAAKITEPAATVTAEPAATAPAASATAEPAASATAEPAASAVPEPAASAAEEAPAAAAAPDPEKAKALTKKALSMLEAGAYKKSIEFSQSSIEADPTDANPYLYWGTALMEMGKRADAKKIFADCVEKATRGPKGECKAFK